MAAVPSARLGLRRAEVVAALSLAIDLNMGQVPETFLRACILAVRLGEAAGLNEAELRDVFYIYIALLRFVGCTSDGHLSAAAFGDEIVFRSLFGSADASLPSEVLKTILLHLGEGQPPLRRMRALLTAVSQMPALKDAQQAHCEVGRNLAGRLSLGESVQLGLDQVYERWDGKRQPSRLAHEAIALPARVVHLALGVGGPYRASGVEAALAVARARSGGAFDNKLVERFCAVAPDILSAADEGGAWEAALACEPRPHVRLSETEIEQAAQAVADFTDLQSPYLAGHSRGVAALAAAASARRGLVDAEIARVRRAGYLHDLGRVAGSAGTWGKAGALTAGEWDQVRLHPYHTSRALSRSPLLAEYGAVAALHHERLDGSGYHRGVVAAQLSESARVLAAADVYRALVEPRPHRPARPPDQAAAVIREESRSGRLDRETVEAVLAAAGHRPEAARTSLPAGLTEREVEVLRLLACGHSNREMGATLSISAKTVGHHIQHIYDKIGVLTRPAATLFALQHELLELQGQ